MANEQDHPDIIAPPPALFLASLGVGFGLDHVLPLPAAPLILLRYPGAALILAALVLVLSASRGMRKAGNQVNPYQAASALVVDGIFRFSRNPMYLSLCLLQSGIGLLTGGLYHLPAALAFSCLLTRWVIVPEERYLKGKFGSAYTDYCQRTRRWF